MQRREEEHAGLGLDHRLRGGGRVGLPQDSGREERVDRPQAREGQPALGPAEPPDGDAPLGEVEDLQLLRRSAPRLVGEGGDLRQHDPAVEVPEALQEEVLVLHAADAVVEEAVHGEADHVLEGDGAGPLLEERGPVGELEEGERHAPDLARDGGAHLVAVHDPGLHEGLAEAAPAVRAHQRGDAVEVLLGDAAVGDEGLPQAVPAEVARGEDQPAVVEEGDLDHAARAHLQVAAAPLGGEPADGLGDRAPGDVGQHRAALLSTAARRRQGTPPGEAPEGIIAAGAGT